MNITQTTAYLSMTDDNLIALGLAGLANNREVAAQFTKGAKVEESQDGVTFVQTDDPAWDLGIIYQVVVKFAETVATKFVAPVEDVPAVGANYFSPCLTDARKYLIYSWLGSEGDVLRLSRGLVHLTIAAATAHADALLNVKNI